MLNYLVRRAAQAGLEQLNREQRLEKQFNAFSELDYEFPAWGIALLALTTLAFVVLASSIEYTVRLLIINLAIVESPTSAAISIYKPVSVSEDPDLPLEKRDPYMDVEVETATVFSKPITSSIRRSVQHLQTLGGFRARWRGLRIMAVYTGIVSIVQLIVSILPLPFAPVIGSFAGPLIAARVHCAWTHATISMPSEKQLKDRLLPCKVWRQLAMPTIVKTGATEATMIFTIGMAVWSFNQLSDLLNAKEDACLAYMFWLAAPVVVAAASFILLVIPAYVVLIRKEASLLPAEEDTVVPMDRTFGGRTCEITGFLRPEDAWKSFTNEAWARVVKLYVKFTFITIALAAFFFQTIFIQMWLIMGDNFDVLMESAAAMLEMLST